MRFTPTAVVAAIGALATVLIRYSGSHSSTLRTHRKLLPAECAAFPPNTFLHITSKHTGYALSVAGASTANNAHIVQNPEDFVGAQDNWRFVPAGNGFYHIFNQNSGLALSRTYAAPILMGRFI